MPRSASLAPSSRMTMSGFSASDQSSRARPPAVVSPETPALTTRTLIPSLFSRASSRAGKVASAGSPNPAVRLSPKARISGTRAAAGPVDILRGVSLRIDPGETVALLGPSGSGKTSLMMIVAGLERPTGGRAMLAGHNLGALDENALARLRRSHVGIVFQAFHLLPTMTALENVAIPLELAGERDALMAAEAALARVGLGHRLSHYPGQLSGGEQQRVAMARAL